MNESERERAAKLLGVNAIGFRRESRAAAQSFTCWVVAKHNLSATCKYICCVSLVSTRKEAR